MPTYKDFLDLEIAFKNIQKDTFISILDRLIETKGYSTIEDFLKDILKFTAKEIKEIKRKNIKEFVLQHVNQKWKLMEFIEAVEKGDLGTVKKFVEVDNVDINQKFQYLLTKGAAVDEVMISTFVKVNNVEMTKLLLPYYLDINHKYKSARYKKTLLLIATHDTKKNYVEMVKLLLRYGADPNLENNPSEKDTPFKNALQWGNIEIIKALLFFGAKRDEFLKVKSKYSNEIPNIEKFPKASKLISAVKENNLEKFKKYDLSLCDIDMLVTPKDYNLLYLAILENRYKIAKHLLMNGANANCICGEEEETLLHLALREKKRKNH
ncbi:hypothetical protein ABK040_005104 [Willaertia magna]